MKKALIIAAASIAASLFAVSCVENIESASVAEIRQSKTEQLEALAETYRIQAATDSLSAAAQAELYRAQAEHQRAMALLEQAKADAEGLAAEKIRLQMEQEAQKFALEIEKLRLEYNKKILDLQNKIDAAYATMLDNANNRIVALFGSYRDALDDLNTYKIDLNNYQTNLVAAENDVIDVQEEVKKETARLEGEIAKTKDAIALYENYSGFDKGELQEEFDKINEVESPVVYSEYKTALHEMELAREDYETMYSDYYYIDNISETTVDVIKIIDSLCNGAFKYNFNNTSKLEKFDPVAENEELTYSDYGYYYGFYSLYFTSYEIPDADDQWKNAADYYENYIDGLDSEIEGYETNIEGLEAQIGTSPSTDEPAGTGLLGTIAGLEEDREAAVEAGNTAGVERIDAEIKAAQEEIARLKKEIGYREADIAEVEAEIAQVKAEAEHVAAMRKSYDEAYTSYAETVKAMKDHSLVSAYYTACIAVDALYDKWSDINQRRNALNSMIQSGDFIDVDVKIAELEEKIAGYEEDIEDLTSVDLKNAEDLVTYWENQIVIVTEQIAAQQAIVDRLKAALDEAMAEDEEAPAE